MAEEVKRKALIFLGLALVMTLLIGVGLPRLKLQPGMALPSFDNGQVVLAPTGETPAMGLSINVFFLILFAIVLTGFLLFLIYRMVKGVNWKELLSNLFSFLGIIIVIMGILYLMITMMPQSQAQLPPIELPTPIPLQTVPLGPVPAGLLWFVAIALILAAVGLGIWILRSRPQAPLGQWELGAEKARQALLAGQDLKSVILLCYQQMSLALQEEQEIEREAFMTTGEFESLLTAKGVPQAPVHQLTQLFDAVRYGQWQPNPSDEQKALSSLDAILAYSRETPQAS